ncbi:hypothetical protein [Rathayibacter sp. VKM Ac-2630]|uniref:hypothetical protein n=1 Tax=Rathayibacter sp. VKM Ac-2630 TaxID=1938617 RepID=UPI000982276D|nr:hypothetical protein [Rathayibacter sp. VKM Ac-2630]OOB90231.1 hypothetical protein B0T42_12915 [Rathayibacter sp. VKM Ac-2630]
MPSTPVRGDSGAPSRAPEHSGAPAHSTRRSLVRAAVWSAPVIAVALATPAAAASEAPLAPRTSDATLAFNNFTSWPAQWNATGPTATVTALQIQNRYWHVSSVGAPVPVLSVRVRYPASTRPGSAPTAVSGAGWSFTAAVPSTDGSVDYLFTWSGSVLDPGWSTPTLEYTADVVASGLTAEVSAPNADPVRA